MSDFNPDISDDLEVGPSATPAGLMAEIQRLRGLLYGRPGKVIYVDGNSGSDEYTGKSFSGPLLTMAAAFDELDSGDTILVKGNIREQLTSPAGVFDVTIRGVGTRPRHADAHTGNNGYQATATWKAPASPTATTPLLRIQQQGWQIENLLIAGPTDYAAIDFVRNAGAGDLERDGSHGAVRNCRFASGLDGIRIGKAGSFTENVFNIMIEDNIANDLTGAFLAAAGFAYRMKVRRNLINTCHDGIIAALTQSLIYDNIVSNFTTKGIDLNGGGGLNVITKNYLSGTYSIAGGYRGSNANDEWAGNFNTLAGGITVADPA